MEFPGVNMKQPDRFGPFLLFQQTESTGYRSCYRAGITKGRAVDRIVRLEIYDKPDLDPVRLLSHFDAAARLQNELRDPHIAVGAGIGEVGGTPFAAYDFELGTTLTAFSSAARQRSFPVPLDQALFIAERVALALAAAHRVEDDGEPVLHTFLTPDSILLSNVGEVRVCGFEVGRALREQLAQHPLFAPYTSPESRAGQSALPQDDVYSLGALLFELVSGRPPSTEPVDLDELTVQATGEGVPEGLKTLLKSSFAAPNRRIPDVPAWQQAIGKLILDGEYNPTTFNLSFLLHTLLREPLERGVEALEREKRFVLDSRPTPSPTGSEPSTPNVLVAAQLDEPDEPDEIEAGLLDAVDEFDPEHDVTGPGVDRGLVTSFDRRPFWLGFAASVLAASAIVSAWLVLGGASENSAASATSAQQEAIATSASIAGRATPAAPDTVPPGAEEAQVPFADADPGSGSKIILSGVVHGELDRSELEPQVEPEPQVDPEEVSRAVAERAREIERSLKAEYEEKLERLRIEMAASMDRKASEESMSAAESATAPAASTEEELPDAGGAARGQEVFAAKTPTATGAAAESAAKPQSARAARTNTNDVAPSSDAVEPPPGQAEAESPRAPAGVPAPPAVVPAQLVRLNPPTYPLAARRLGLSATARVKVLITPRGKVEEAEILGPPLGSGFDVAALAAVRRSRWEPATLDGKPIESTSVLTLEFKP